MSAFLENVSSNFKLVLTFLPFSKHKEQRVYSNYSAEQESNNINFEAAELPGSVLDVYHSNSTDTRCQDPFSGVIGWNRALIKVEANLLPTAQTIKQHVSQHKTTKHFCKSQQPNRPTNTNHMDNKC